MQYDRSCLRFITSSHVFEIGLPALRTWFPTFHLLARKYDAVSVPLGSYCMQTVVVFHAACFANVYRVVSALHVFGIHDCSILDWPLRWMHAVSRCYSRFVLKAFWCRINITTSCFWFDPYVNLWLLLYAGMAQGASIACRGVSASSSQENKCVWILLLLLRL